MAPTLLYKDLSKTCNDTLNDDYDFNRKLKIKTKTQNGVALTSEGTMSASNKAILAKVSAAFTHPSGINVKKLQVTTHGRLVGEAEVANAFVDNLKLTFKIEDGSLKNPAGLKYKQVGKIGGSYKGDGFTVNDEIDFSSNSISAAATFNYQDFIFGASGAFSLDKSSITDHNVAATYAANDFHATVQTKKKFGVVSASFHHRACGNLIYAAVMDYDLKTQNNSLVVGSRYSTDPATKFASKVDSEGLVSLSCIQKVRPAVTLTTSAHVDVKNLEGDSHKFGIGLTLG